MILVIAHLRLRAGTCDRFDQAVRKVIPPSREEVGNVSYETLRGLDAAEDAVFIERWKDRAALDEHFGTQHFKVFDSALAALLDGTPHVELFEIASSEKL